MLFLVPYSGNLQFATKVMIRQICNFAKLCILMTKTCSINSKSCKFAKFMILQQNVTIENNVADIQNSMTKIYFLQQNVAVLHFLMYLFWLQKFMIFHTENCNYTSYTQFYICEN